MCSKGTGSSSSGEASVLSEIHNGENSPAEDTDRFDPLALELHTFQAVAQALEMPAAVVLQEFLLRRSCATTAVGFPAANLEDVHDQPQCTYTKLQIQNMESENRNEVNVVVWKNVSKGIAEMNEVMDCV